MGTCPLYVEGRNHSMEPVLDANFRGNGHRVLLFPWEIEIPVAFYLAFILGSLDSVPVSPVMR